MFDWEDLRHFIALADAGTLSGAARMLKVDHATVGRRVAGLERSLDRMLVERLPKRWVLTEAGREIAILARDMQAQAHALERAARAQYALLSGTVTVSTPPAFAAYFLTPRLPALRRLYPDLQLQLLGSPALASLSRQEADIAVRLTRPEEAGSLIRRIGAMEFWFYAAPGYADKPAADWQFLAYDASLDHVPEQAALLAFAGERPVVFRTNELASQVGAARAGMGIAMLPCFLAYQDPGLVPLSTELPRVVRDIYLVIHADLRRMPAIRAVLEFVAEQVADGMPLGLTSRASS
jgi:DNA-binding transcriptional LysR family regulator